ncbi:MAG TPA: hydrogenase maturation protease [Aggregatilineaceae bacterium]|nr:hydrogenase maturation protease [Aggregatilineaceae bacterium]
MAKTLLVGLGNPILTDDAIGWRVVEQTRDHFELGDVDIQLVCVGGLSLAELMIGYKRVIIVDSIITKRHLPGTVYHLALCSLPETLNSSSAHDTNLTTALEALRRFNAPLPDNDAIEFVAVEALDVWTFGESCTPDVAASIPTAAERVWSLLQS